MLIWQKKKIFFGSFKKPHCWGWSEGPRDQTGNSSNRENECPRRDAHYSTLKEKCDDKESR